ncbi:erythromycin esterase family protein [Legionella maioricensis]|uniref:Erythromycin esterase family protein n=1 Tax=Legionella maioricensis TaxID=2896528 RepID=A0A9X2D202_9GAMM|nr:erythromycin esterase family protein [Legionella maioricensis]MCL9684961.1 erythromycin esterase family protein [Legionella maioricensis]MCL9688207.1 erythromycin esterase family protein [Legionella maioricensis]
MSKDAMYKLIEVITESALPLQEQNETYDALLDKIGNARFVMIGEASHGTHEFYQARIKITQRLIKERGFMAVAIEGDWPDAYHVHRYLQGKGGSNDAERALEQFKRFPTWMWRNTTMPPFLCWLRTYNDQVTPPSQKIGFYGLDLYSLNASIEAVIHFLMKIDPEAARRAQQRYSCFDHVNIEPQMYGYLINAGIKKSCINEAIAELIELQHRAFEYLRHDGIAAEDEYFFATQNARLVKNAENYYRSMLEGQVTSWNIRDRHMAETLNVLVDHLETRWNKPAKIIIWAHNSHVGDARATEMSERGEVNIGQLVREQYDTHSYSIGFSTYEGFVSAASDWDEPVQRKKVMPGLPGSYEELFHHIQYKNFLLNLIGNQQLEHFLQLSRLQRAIGVIYRPDTERFSHYFFTHLPYQFDSLIHFDKTNAVQPLGG